MAKTSNKHRTRMRRKQHIRKNINGCADRPRLSIFRTSNHIYAQLIDDVSGRTIASSSTLNKILAIDNGGNVEAAKVVGEDIATKALDVGISRCVVDRNGYLFHGRVKALAFATKNKGLQI